MPVEAGFGNAVNLGGVCVRANGQSERRGIQKAISGNALRTRPEGDHVRTAPKRARAVIVRPGEVPRVAWEVSDTESAANHQPVAHLVSRAEARPPVVV